jgi:hypothetical protein
MCGHGFRMIFSTASKRICRVVYKKSLFIFVILPLAFLFCVTLLKSARGPYWHCMNMDPEYVYLINSLNYATGLPIGHHDHPGTTLQVSGAWILKSFHFFRDANLLAEDVLKNPEVYLGLLNRIFLGLTTLLIILVGWLGFRKSHNKQFAFLLQSSPFFSTTILLSAGRTNPEPFLLWISFAIILVILYFRTTVPQGSYKQYVFLFAALCGLGVATKVTFLPVTLVPLFILPRFYRKLSFLILTATFFLGFTSPIISSYHSVFGWFGKLFVHTEIYGAGSATIIDPEVYLFNIKHLHWSEPVFFIVLYAALITWIMEFFSYRKKAILKRNEFQILSGLIACQLTSVFLVAKHFVPQKEYYLLPALVLSGLVFGLVLEQRKPDKILVTSVLVMFGIMRVYGTIDAYHGLEMVKREELRVFRQVEELSEYAKVYYDCASAPPYALRYGTTAWSYNRHAAVLNQLYPRVYFYDVMTQQYFDWNDQTNLDRIWSESDGRVIFQGTPLDMQRRPPGLEDIFGGHYQTIYRLAP